MSERKEWNNEKSAEIVRSIPDRPTNTGRDSMKS
jgi:hypothetical protein